MRGGVLSVEVVQALPPIEFTAVDNRAHVVALYDGVIESIVALQGVAMVKPGDTVQKGDILIRGYFEHASAAPRYVHANGIVQARVWVRHIESGSLQALSMQRTGVQHNSSQIVLPFITPPQMEYPFLFFEEETRLVTLNPGFLLPVKIEYKTVYELASTMDEAIAYARLEAIAYAKCRQKIADGAKIIDNYVKYSNIGDDEMAVEYTMETLVLIGEEWPF